MHKNIFFSVVITFVIVGGFWCGFSIRDIQSETTKVKIAYLPLVHGSPLYLAVEKGYFTQVGLDVELVAFQSPGQIIDALLQGQVDFTSPGGATGIVAIADFKNPGKLKIYGLAGGDNTVQNDALLVRNDSPIKTIADLKGKKLGVLVGSVQWQTIAKDFLTQNNLVVGKDVVLVDLPINLQTQALVSGQVDALIALEPIPTVIKNNNLGKELVSHFSSQYVANPFYGGAGIVRLDFADQNPEITEKVLKVFSQSIGEITQNPDAARPYLKKYLSIDDAVIANVPISRFRMSNQVTTQEIEATQKFMDIFTTHKIIDGTIDFKSLLYYSK